MVDERLTEGSIYDINVVYNPKLVGYMTSMSHMNELYAIGFGTPEIIRDKIRNKIIINL